MRGILPKTVWAALLVLALGSWQLMSAHNPLIRLFISSPRDLVNYMPLNASMLISATFVTGFEAACGLGLAFAIAVGAGILVSIDRRLINWVLPPMILSQVVPLITIAPILIVIVGLGIESKILMAAIISFFPVFINVAVSIRDTPPAFNEMMMLYRPTWLFRVRHIHLPLSLPALMAALRVAATLAVIGAIVAEFTGADAGLGKNLFLATRRLEPELMMSSIVLSALLGAFLYSIVVLIERLLGRWYLR
jgi:NitT/TauT family transport system permease protein